jgi:hypothetical protein
VVGTDHATQVGHKSAPPSRAELQALAYMRERALAAHVIARLVEHPDRYFADQEAWNAHLENFGISALKINPDPVLIATEGALWGSVNAHGFLPTP